MWPSAQIRACQSSMSRTMDVDLQVRQASIVGIDTVGDPEPDLVPRLMTPEVHISGLNADRAQANPLQVPIERASDAPLRELLIHLLRVGNRQRQLTRQAIEAQPQPIASSRSRNSSTMIGSGFCANVLTSRALLTAMRRHHSSLSGRGSRSLSKSAQRTNDNPPYMTGSFPNSRVDPTLAERSDTEASAGQTEDESPVRIEEYPRHVHEGWGFCGDRPVVAWFVGPNSDTPFRTPHASAQGSVGSLPRLCCPCRSE
jgi:hypothetical protein